MSPNACKVSEKKILQKAMQGFKKKKKNTNLSCILIFDLTLLIHKHPKLAVFSLIIIAVLQPQAKQCKEINFANIV